MKIAILGFGREGKSLLKFLKKSAKYRRAEIEILDQKYDKNYLKNLGRFDFIFRSPGVPYNLPEIQRAVKKGVKFSSVTKLFFDEVVKILQRGSGQVIGITGTKGKGTTAALLYQILKQCGRHVHLAGNIGTPALDILPKIKKNSLVILELSSFQLQDLKKSPAVAVITDVFPDHMEVHKSMNEYIEAKSQIVRHQNKKGAVFYFKDNPLSRAIAKKSAGRKIGVIGNPFGLKKNYVMAAAVAAYLGCPPEKIFHTIKNFKGLEHRMEFVREIRGIRFYNDSASTNPQTTAAAIRSLSQVACRSPLILIAGGKDKNLDYAPLAKAIKKSGGVRKVILIGENKQKIKKALSRAKAPIKMAKNLKSALTAAYKDAKKLINLSTCQLITILLSPASASFDMFKDYADRGKKFKEIVLKLK
jgi:UDP-N-acetylmuramoylalanine--D-glutamate ligase